jgi:hypothetical protein
VIADLVLRLLDWRDRHPDIAASAFLVAVVLAAGSFETPH